MAGFGIALEQLMVNGKDIKKQDYSQYWWENLLTQQVYECSACPISMCFKFT